MATRNYLWNYAGTSSALAAMYQIGRALQNTNQPILKIEPPIQKSDVVKSGQNYTETHLGNSPADDISLSPFTLVNELPLYWALGYLDTLTIKVPPVGTKKIDICLATEMTDDGDDETKFLIDAMIKEWELSWTSFSWEFNAALIGCEHGYYSGSAITGKTFIGSKKESFDGISTITWGGNTLNINFMKITGANEINAHYDNDDTGMYDELSSTHPTMITGAFNLTGIDSNLRTDIAAGTAQTFSFIMTKSSATQILTFTLTNCKLYSLEGLTPADSRAGTNVMFVAEEITILKDANGLTVNDTNFPSRA